jgi:hypothetical protein
MACVAVRCSHFRDDGKHVQTRIGARWRLATSALRVNSPAAQPEPARCPTCTIVATTLHPASHRASSLRIGNGTHHPVGWSKYLRQGRAVDVHPPPFVVCRADEWRGWTDTTTHVLRVRE